MSFERLDGRFQSVSWRLNALTKCGVFEWCQNIRNSVKDTNITQLVDYEVCAALGPKVSQILLVVAKRETILEYNNCTIGHLRKFCLNSGKENQVETWWIAIFMAIKEHFFWGRADLSIEEFEYATKIELAIWPIAQSNPNWKKCALSIEVEAFGNFIAAVGFATPASKLLDQARESQKNSINVNDPHENLADDPPNAKRRKTETVPTYKEQPASNCEKEHAESSKAN